MMPGMADSSAAAEATITESPTAVTWRPEIFGDRLERHSAAGLAAGEAVVLSPDGWVGWADWEAVPIRWPSATCRKSPAGAAGAGGRATP